jgi:hypothetical protein
VGRTGCTLAKAAVVCHDHLASALLTCISSEQNPNVSHYAALLDAELEALKGDHYAASKSYEVAILYAGRRGLTQDRALAHERYGEHLARIGNERDQDAEFQMAEAVKLYEEWGAYAKVQLMSRQYQALLSPPTEIHIETAT